MGVEARASKGEERIGASFHDSPWELSCPGGDDLALACDAAALGPSIGHPSAPLFFRGTHACRTLGSISVQSLTQDLEGSMWVSQKPYTHSGEGPCDGTQTLRFIGENETFFRSSKSISNLVFISSSQVQWAPPTPAPVPTVLISSPLISTGDELRSQITRQEACCRAVGENGIKTLFFKRIYF